MSGRRPRIPPIVGAGEEASALLAKGYQHDGAALNAARTLAHDPRLLKRFTVFAGLFLSHSLLPERDRELVTLRCAYLFQSDYYFGHHVLLAAHVLSSEEITRTAGPTEAWVGFDRLLLDAADELATTWELCDATWDALAAHYDEPQLVHLVLLVGFYRMTCLYANTIGIEREPGVPGWPQEGDET